MARVIALLCSVTTVNGLSWVGRYGDTFSELVDDGNTLSLREYYPSYISGYEDASGTVRYNSLWHKETSSRVF